MQARIIKTIKRFHWPHWLALGLLILIAGFTTYKTIHTVHEIRYWRSHRDEPLRGWMTIKYVSHSYRVPPHALRDALGLPPKPDRRPLRAIAKAQGRSLDDVKASLMTAIMQARAANPPPSPPPPKQGGAR
jgi:hypothetical protein